MTTWSTFARPAVNRQTGSRNVLLLLILVFGLLPAVPGVRETSNAVTSYSKFIYPLLIFAVGYFVVTLMDSKFIGKAGALGISVFLLALVSTALSTQPLVTKTFVQTVLIPLLVFIALQSVRQKDIINIWTTLRRVLFLACLIGVAYYASYAGLAILSPSFVFGHHYDVDFQSLVGNNLYGNPNNASVIYLTALGLGLHHLRQSKTRRGIAAFAVVVEVIAVFMTGSTGAILCAIILGIVSMLRRIDNSASFLRLYTTLLTAGFGIAIWRLGYADLGSTRGTTGRLDARLAALHGIPDHFWVGSGPGSSGLVINEQLSAAFGENLTGTYTTAHDMFLNWCLDFGVPSLVLLLTAVIVATLRILRSEDWTLILPLLGFVLGAEAAGIAIVTPSNPAWAVLFWVLLGLGWATSRRAVSYDELAVEGSRVHVQGGTASKMRNHAETEL